MLRCADCNCSAVNCTRALNSGASTVETTEPSSDDDVLAMAARVYAGLADDDIDEIEQIALNRGDFFGLGNA